MGVIHVRASRRARAYVRDGSQSIRGYKRLKSQARHITRLGRLVNDSPSEVIRYRAKTKLNQLHRSISGKIKRMAGDNSSVYNSMMRHMGIAGKTSRR